MSAAPRKRAATSSEDVPGPSKKPQKKTRIVEPEDDPVNFAEEVDANLETRQRRGRVKTEGYDSDSSDDGEGVVPSRRPGAGKEAAEDEDDDMFAMGEKEEQKAEESGKKEQKFLRLGDIEGQEFNEQTSDKSGSDEDEPEDEDDAERRKKAGMGYELSSFNMREEMEEGKFAEDGTYVRTFDPHAAHDKWMEGLDEQEIKKARRNHRQREKEQREKQKAEEEEMRQMGGRPEIEKELAAMLKKGETVLEALQRLGAQAKKNGASKRRCVTSLLMPDYVPNTCLVRSLTINKRETLLRTPQCMSTRHPRPPPTSTTLLISPLPSWVSVIPTFIQRPTRSSYARSGLRVS